MATEKPDVEDLLYRPERYLIETYGEWGYTIVPFVETHCALMEFIAVMDDYDTGVIYDPSCKIYDLLITMRDQIIAELEQKITIEFEL